MKKGKNAGLLLLYVVIFLSVICLQTYALRNSGTWMQVDFITVGIAVAGGLVFRILLRSNDTELPKKDAIDEKETILTKREYVVIMEPYGLTKRELELGFLLFSGYSNQRIAQELFISEATVKKHVTHIYEKTNVQSRKEFKGLFYDE